MVSRLAKVLALALAIAAIFSGVGVAAPLEVMLYDGSPEPGRPTALGITAFPLYADQRNLKDSTGEIVVLANDASGRMTADYVYTPKQAMRYAVIFDLRVDGWRTTERRTVYVDYRKCPKLTPLTFHVVVMAGKQGPFSTGETTVLLRGKESLILELTTNKLAHLSRLGEPLKYHVALKSLDATVSPVPLAASLIDWHGNERKLDAWKGSTPSRYEVTARVDSPGFYRLRVQASGWGEAALDGGVLRPTTAKNDRIGINVHWSDWFPGHLMEGSGELLAMQGVHWIRSEYEWRGIEWIRGTYNWSQYDLIADVCRHNGLSVLPCMFRVPPWASVAPESPDFTHHIMKREYFDDYYNYVTAVAKRYPDVLKTISVWNEVDSAWFQGGTAEDYYELLKGCSERLKAYDPTIRTTCSGISATGRSTAADFLRKVLKLGGASYFDIADCHYMGSDRVAQFKADLKTAGADKKPLWVTEQSANMIPDRSLGGAARTAADKMKGLIASLAANPEKLFLWGEIDMHPNICLWGNIKGVDRTLRPSYFAFATIIDLLADKRCEKIYSETPELHAYRFGTVFVLWSDVESAVCLEGMAPVVERIDLMGARVSLRTTGKRFVFPIGPEPVFLRCEKAPARIRAAAAFSMQEFGAAPGTEAALHLRILNPLGRTSTARVSLKAPAGWQSPVEMRIKLRPHEEKTLALRLRVPEDVPAGRVVPVTATVLGLAERPITAGASVRAKTKEGVLLIEAESAPRSQGRCPGSPMWVDEQPAKSGGSIVAMFWGESWMEYDLPFARPGSYSLGVYAMGRFTGHPDEKPLPIGLAVSLDGKRLGDLSFQDGRDWMLNTMPLDIQKAGTHTIKLEFPVDTGDVFVDYLTLSGGR